MGQRCNSSGVLQWHHRPVYTYNWFGGSQHRKRYKFKFTFNSDIHFSIRLFKLLKWKIVLSLGLQHVWFVNQAFSLPSVPVLAHLENLGYSCAAHKKLHIHKAFLCESSQVLSVCCQQKLAWLVGTSELVPRFCCAIHTLMIPFYWMRQRNVQCKPWLYMHVKSPWLCLFLVYFYSHTVVHSVQC